MSRRRRTQKETAAPRGQGGGFVRRSLMDAPLTPGRGRLPSCTKATTGRSGVRPDSTAGGAACGADRGARHVLGVQRQLISARSAQRQGGLEVWRHAASPEGTERAGASTVKEAQPPGASRFSLQREGAMPFATTRLRISTCARTSPARSTSRRSQTPIQRCTRPEGFVDHAISASNATWIGNLNQSAQIGIEGNRSGRCSM